MFIVANTFGTLKAIKDHHLPGEDIPKIWVDCQIKWQSKDALLELIQSAECWLQSCMAELLEWSNYSQCVPPTKREAIKAHCSCIVKPSALWAEMQLRHFKCALVCLVLLRAWHRV